MRGIKWGRDGTAAWLSRTAATIGMLMAVGGLGGCLEGDAADGDGGLLDALPASGQQGAPRLSSPFVLNGTLARSLPGGSRVLVGVPRADTGNGFVELARDGDVVLNTFGQGGFHAELAVACKGFGNFAYPRFHLENLDGEGEVMSPEFSAAQPLSCDDDGTCVRSPNYVLLGGLVDDPDALDNLHIRITVTIKNDDGLMGEGTQTGYLRAAF